MTKTQDALKQRLDKAREIYEALLHEYQSLPQDKRWNYGLERRTCAKIQLELVISERKAHEYIRLVQMSKKLLAVQ